MLVVYRLLLVTLSVESMGRVESMGSGVVDLKKSSLPSTDTRALYLLRARLSRSIKVTALTTVVEERPYSARVVGSLCVVVSCSLLRAMSCSLLRVLSCSLLKVLRMLMLDSMWLFISSVFLLLLSSSSSLDLSSTNSIS